jgi:TonB family protein
MAPNINLLYSSVTAKTVTSTRALLTALTLAVGVVQAQTQRADQPQMITINLGPDQIGTIKTAERLLTRLIFPEPVKEIVCGDLYDSTSGSGAFVVQHIDNDIFLKPIVPKGISNLFVKVGERGERVYNFSLKIVPFDQAYFSVKVLSASEEPVRAEKAVEQTRPRSVSPPVLPDIETSGLTRDDDFEDVSIPLGASTRVEVVEPPPTPPPALRAASSKDERIADLKQIEREPIKRVTPDYPALARISGVKGEVLVEVTIDAKGKVTSARAIDGPPLLRSAATVAARFWRFAPVEDSDKSRQDVKRIVFKFH